MNHYWLAAAVLLAIVALLHSLLGEWRLFVPHRAPGRWVPHASGHRLGVQWVGWHLTSLLGAVLALTLWERGRAGGTLSVADQHLGLALGFVLLLASAWLAAATRGRHLGWLGLSAAGCLTLFGLSA